MVFLHISCYKRSIGNGKRYDGCKTTVLYESDDLIAMASEEVAIRAIFPRNDTSDPMMRR